MSNHPKQLYTHSERKQILDYIISHHAYFDVKGNLLWKEMERLQVCNRTWQSMKQHFKTNILSSLNCFKLSQAEIKRIHDGYHNIVKKPQPVPNRKTTIVDELPTPRNLNAIHFSDSSSSDKSSDNVAQKRKRLVKSISEEKEAKIMKTEQNSENDQWIRPNLNLVADLCDNDETIIINADDSEPISDVLESTNLLPFGKEEEIKIIKFFEKHLDRLEEKDLDGPYIDINTEYKFYRPVRFLRDRFLNEILPNLIKYNCLSNTAMVTFYDKSDMDIPDQLVEMIDEEYNQNKHKTQKQMASDAISISSTDSLDATPPLIHFKTDLTSNQDASSSSQLEQENSEPTRPFTDLNHLEISQTESHYYSQNDQQVTTDQATNERDQMIAQVQQHTQSDFDQFTEPAQLVSPVNEHLDDTIISLNTQLNYPATSIGTDQHLNVSSKRDPLKLVRNDIYQNSPRTNDRDRLRLIDKYKSPLYLGQFKTIQTDQVCQTEQQVELTPESILVKSQNVQTNIIQLENKSTMTDQIMIKDVLLHEYATHCESNCALISTIAGSIGMYLNKALHVFVPNSVVGYPEVVKLIARKHHIDSKQVHVLNDDKFAYIRKFKLVKDEYLCFLQNIALKALPLQEYLLASKTTTDQSENNSDVSTNETPNIDSADNSNQIDNTPHLVVQIEEAQQPTTETDENCVLNNPIITTTNENTQISNKMVDYLASSDCSLIDNNEIISTKISGIPTDKSLSIEEEIVSACTSDNPKISEDSNSKDISMETSDETCESSSLVLLDTQSEEISLDLNKTLITKNTQDDCSPFKKLSNFFKNKKRDSKNKFKCPNSKHSKTNSIHNNDHNSSKNDSNSSLSPSKSGNIAPSPNIIDNNVSEIVSNQVNVNQKSSELKEDFFSGSVDDVMDFISNPDQKIITSTQIDSCLLKSHCIKNAENTCSKSSHNIINDSIEDVMNYITNPARNIVTSTQIEITPNTINSKHYRKLVNNMDDMMDFILNPNQNKVTNTQIKFPSDIADVQNNSNDNFATRNIIKITKTNNSSTNHIENIDVNPRNIFTNSQNSILNPDNTTATSGEIIKNNQTDQSSKVATNSIETVTFHKTTNDDPNLISPQIITMENNSTSAKCNKSTNTKQFLLNADNSNEKASDNTSIQNNDITLASESPIETLNNTSNSEINPNNLSESSIKEPEVLRELSVVKMQQILEVIKNAAYINQQHFQLPNEYFLEPPTFVDGNSSENCNYKNAEILMEIQDVTSSVNIFKDVETSVTSKQSKNFSAQTTDITKSKNANVLATSERSVTIESNSSKHSNFINIRRLRKYSLNTEIEQIIERNSTNPINEDTTYESMLDAKYLTQLEHSYAANLCPLNEVISPERHVNKYPKLKKKLRKKGIHENILPVPQAENLNILKSPILKPTCASKCSTSKNINLINNMQQISDLVPINCEKYSINSKKCASRVLNSPKETVKLSTIKVKTKQQSESVPKCIDAQTLLKSKQATSIELSPKVNTRINIELKNDEVSSSNRNTKKNAPPDELNSEISSKCQELENSNLTTVNNKYLHVPKISGKLCHTALPKPRRKLRKDKNTDNTHKYSEIESVLIDSESNESSNISSSIINEANIHYSEKSIICDNNTLETYSPNSSIWTDSIVLDSNSSTPNSRAYSIEESAAISPEIIVAPLLAELAPRISNANKTSLVESISNLNCTDSVETKEEFIKDPIPIRMGKNLLSKKSQMAVKNLCINTTHLDVKKIMSNIANDINVKFEKEEIDFVANTPVFELLESKLEWNLEKDEKQLFGKLKNSIE